VLWGPSNPWSATPSCLRSPGCAGATSGRPPHAVCCRMLVFAALAERSFLGADLAFAAAWQPGLSPASALHAPLLLPAPTLHVRRRCRARWSVATPRQRGALRSGSACLQRGPSVIRASAAGCCCRSTKSASARAGSGAGALRSASARRLLCCALAWTAAAAGWVCMEWLQAACRQSTTGRLLHMRAG
jgi:hypothetical protein